jgi:hypothetical protein
MKLSVLSDYGLLCSHIMVLGRVTNIFDEPTVCMCTENSMQCGLPLYPEDENALYL